MARKPREDYEGACHHIIIKAIDGNFMFKDKKVKKKFEYYMIKYKKSHNMYLFAYCILDNHIHLFIQTSDRSSEDRMHDLDRKIPRISEFMRDLLSVFARWYNTYKKRTGPLFNSRFKNFVCKSTPYYIYLINYIHKNPKACGLTDTYNYIYSSYSDFYKNSRICDIEQCCAHIGMPLKDLVDLLNEKMMDSGLPYLEELLIKLRDKQNNQRIEDILTDMMFCIEDFRGTRIADYFNTLRITIIRTLSDVRKMKPSRLAAIFSISRNYVYYILNSA